MVNPCSRTHSVLTALNRENIVASNVCARQLGGEIVLGFHWLGLRRRYESGLFMNDDTELESRLRTIFPNLTDLGVTIDTTFHARRWNRIVQFRVAAEEFDEAVTLKPAERSCA